MITYRFTLRSGRIAKADIRQSLGCSEKVYQGLVNEELPKDKELSDLYENYRNKHSLPIGLAKRVIELITMEEVEFKLDNPNTEFRDT